MASVVPRLPRAIRARTGPKALAAGVPAGTRRGATNQGSARRSTRLLATYREARTMPAVIWLLAAGALINSFGNFVLPFLVLFLGHRGFDASQAGFAIGAYGAGKIVAAPSGGYLADRLGPRSAIALSMISSAAATLALWQLTGEGHIAVYGAAFAVGWTSQLYRPSASAVIASSVAPGQPQVTGFALYQLGSSLGLALGPTLAGTVAAYSFPPLFVGDAATSAVWGIVALAALAPAARGSETAARRSALKTILADRPFMRFWLATLLANIVLFQAESTFPLWVTAHGHTSAVYGALIGLNAAVIVVFQLPLTGYTGRFSPWRVLAVSSLLGGIGFGLLVLGGGLPLLIVSVLVWSGCELIGWPVGRAWLTGHAPPGLVGRYAGAQSLTYGLGLTLAPILGTQLYALSPRLLWLGCLATGLIAALLLRTPVARPADSPTRSAGSAFRWVGQQTDRTAACRTPQRQP
jgi:MFS family permease